MALIKALMVGACALATAVHARPIQEVTVTDIVTNYHYVTIDCVETVWLPLDQSPKATPTPTSTHAPAATTHVRPAIAPEVHVTTTTTKTTTTTTATTTTTPPPPPPPPSPTPQPVTTTTTAPPPPPAAVEVQPTTPAAPAPAPAASPSSAPGNFAASATNMCEGSGDACTGDVTHWDGGLGACGWNVDTKSDMQIALPVGLMGSKSNGNPYCGRSLTIRNPDTGKEVQATVGDKCMGCQGRSIDLTDALFQAVSGADGRGYGYVWWFN